MNTRRSFIKKTSLATASLAIGIGCTPAVSLGRVIGANDTINLGVVGLNGRGWGLVGSIMKLEKVKIVAFCDADQNVLDKRAAEFKSKFNATPSLYQDYRKMLENKEVDAVVIASADHTHAPFSIYALQAGKHVYCEKPISHNPHEAELLVKAQKKYNLLVQIGNQQRSAPTSQMAMKDIREGLIGEVYEAKAWYSNNRGSIGNGKKVVVPSHLDWDLWQGPAPRRDYTDNIVHYNWHWFRHWGTGEISNNGLHEMDICRWALGVDMPKKVISYGGRYHYKNDDWEFFDTQTARFEFEDGKFFIWDGRSCNNQPLYKRGRGNMIYGTKGSILLDRNDYYAYDLKNKEIKHVSEKSLSETTNLVGGGALTDYHLQNFLEAIRKGIKLNSPVSEIYASNHMCLLGNMAQDAGIPLEIDQDGKVTNHAASMKKWKREYEKGWEPKL